MQKAMPLQPISADISTVRILDVPIHCVTMDDVLEIIDESISESRRLAIGCVNSAKLVNMRKDELLRKDVMGSNLVIADGMSVVWASKWLGRELPERVTGIDLMLRLLEKGNERGYRIFCLGASESVSRTVVDKIHDQYPGVIVAGRRDGYFSQEEEEGISREIAGLDVDILFVAMSSPKKEQFMARWGRVTDAKVLHGVGGSFDVIAGKVKRAPESWQRVGLEWLYRVKQEPGRLLWRYLSTNTSFCWQLLKQVFGKNINRLAGLKKR